MKKLLMITIVGLLAVSCAGVKKEVNKAKLTASEKAGEASAAFFNVEYLKLGAAQYDALNCKKEVAETKEYITNKTKEVLGYQMQALSAVDAIVSVVCEIVAEKVIPEFVASQVQNKPCFNARLKQYSIAELGNKFCKTIKL